ncbi:MAG: serine/threonine protein kinase [Deltaproteobacteria bacterium]|nr:serine/threonine protein kinase [Deltaproteobacteria bacterium]
MSVARAGWPGGEREAALRARQGTVLARRWRLAALIGVGGTAAAYRALGRDGLPVAIKMLHAELCGDAELGEQLVRAAYVANEIGHPGAVAVLDDGVAEDGTPFLVLELLEGETVQARCERRGGRLLAAEVLSLTHPLLAALAAAHARDIVHGAIRPDKVFLTRAGAIKVLGFGTAALGSPVTRAAYLAPEQAHAGQGDLEARTDIWAVGATMFALLAGEPVHGAASPGEIMALAAQQPARSLAALVPDSPPALVHLVGRALGYYKQERWPDALAMQEALRQAYEDIVGRPLVPPPRPSVVPDPDTADEETLPPAQADDSGPTTALSLDHLEAASSARSSADNAADDSGRTPAVLVASAEQNGATTAEWRRDAADEHTRENWLTSLWRRAAARARAAAPGGAIAHEGGAKTQELDWPLHAPGGAETQRLSPDMLGAVAPAAVTAAADTGASAAASASRARTRAALAAIVLLAAVVAVGLLAVLLAAR